MEVAGFSFHGRNSEKSLFGGKLVFPMKGVLHKVLGFPLTGGRLCQFPDLGKIPVLGCDAEPDEAKTDDEMFSDHEYDDSEEGCAKHAVVTPYQSPAKECD